MKKGESINIKKEDVYIKKFMLDNNQKQCDKCDHHQENCCHQGCKEHNGCHHQVICPVCHKRGISVPLDTVISLTGINEIKGNFYLCTGQKCEVVYFSDEYIIEKSDINTTVWYKETLDNFIVCYCHNIKLVDIIDAVRETNSTKKEVILDYLGKNLDSNDCLHLNPTGLSCDKLFENALEYAKNINNS